MNLTVETSCTKQGFVQNISTIGGSQDNHTAIGAKAVHLGKQLVQGTLTLIVGPHLKASATGTTHGIYLVDKDNTRRFLLSLTEEVAYTTGTNAHKHLYKVATRHREERYVGFASHSLCQKGLTRSRRTNQQSPLGYLTTQVCIFIRILQELYNLLHLLLGTSLAGHILEGNLAGLLLIYQLGTAPAYVEDSHRTASATASTAAHTAHDENPEKGNKDKGTKAPQKVGDGIATVLIFNITAEMSRLVLLLHKIFQLIGRRVLRLHNARSSGLYLGRGEYITQMRRLHIHYQGSFLLVYYDFTGIPFFYVLLELAVGHLLGAAIQQ